MKPSSEAVSPLRQRMIDDMRMRKLELKTRTAYLRAVKKLADFLKRSPDTATVEDLRRFQLYLVDQGTSPITINATGLNRSRGNPFANIGCRSLQRSCHR